MTFYDVSFGKKFDARKSFIYTGISDLEKENNSATSEPNLKVIVLSSYFSNCSTDFKFNCITLPNKHLYQKLLYKQFV